MTSSSSSSFNIRSGSLDQFNDLMLKVTKSRQSASKDGMLYVIIDPNDPALLNLTSDKAQADKFGKFASITEIVDTITKRWLKETPHPTRSLTNRIKEAKSTLPALFDSVKHSKRQRETESELPAQNAEASDRRAAKKAKENPDEDEDGADQMEDAPASSSASSAAAASSSSQQKKPKRKGYDPVEGAEKHKEETVSKRSKHASENPAVGAIDNDNEVEMRSHETDQNLNSILKEIKEKHPSGPIPEAVVKRVIQTLTGLNIPSLEKYADDEWQVIIRQILSVQAKIEGGSQLEDDSLFLKVLQLNFRWLNEIKASSPDMNVTEIASSIFNIFSNKQIFEIWTNPETPRQLVEELREAKIIDEDWNDEIGEKIKKDVEESIQEAINHKKFENFKFISAHFDLIVQDFERAFTITCMTKMLDLWFDHQQWQQVTDALPGAMDAMEVMVFIESLDSYCRCYYSGDEVVQNFEKFMQKSAILYQKLLRNKEQKLELILENVDLVKTAITHLSHHEDIFKVFDAIITRLDSLKNEEYHFSERIQQLATEVLMTRCCSHSKEDPRINKVVDSKENDKPVNYLIKVLLAAGDEEHQAAILAKLKKDRSTPPLFMNFSWN